MTLDEAIRRLQEDIDSIGDDEIDTLTKAEMLGIEALRRELDNRSGSKYVIVKSLKGETKEYCKYCGLVHAGIECPSREGEK